MRLVNGAGVVLATADSTTNNEALDFTVPVTGQNYYIQVYFDDEGNSYDLEWDDLISGSSNAPSASRRSRASARRRANSPAQFNGMHRRRRKKINW